MNYYAFHVGDYLSHTRHLSPMEDLAYRRMLDWYYLHERPFNGRSTDVARLIGMREYEAEVEAVLREFFEEVEGRGWVNKRADEEIASYSNKRKLASEAGKRSASKRNVGVNGRSTDVEPTFNKESTDVQLTTPNTTPSIHSEENTMGAQPEAESSKRKRKVSIEVSKPEDVTQEVWDGFLALRKARNAPVTSVAIERIRNEAAKVSYSLDSALAMCCARGWQGFHADWTKSREEMAKPKSRHDLSGMDYSRGIGPNGEIL